LFFVENGMGREHEGSRPFDFRFSDFDPLSINQSRGCGLTAECLRAMQTVPGAIPDSRSNFHFL
jgi:hypothetical protein